MFGNQNLPEQIVHLILIKQNIMNIRFLLAYFIISLLSACSADTIKVRSENQGSLKATFRHSSEAFLKS